MNKKLIYDLMFFTMGCFGTSAWFMHLFYILSAFFNDKSIGLGYKPNSGLVVLSYNESGEMFFEIFLFSIIFLFSLFTTIFILFKRREVIKERLK